MYLSNIITLTWHGWTVIYSRNFRLIWRWIHGPFYKHSWQKWNTYKRKKLSKIVILLSIPFHFIPVVQLFCILPKALHNVYLFQLYDGIYNMNSSFLFQSYNSQLCVKKDIYLCIQVISYDEKTMINVLSLIYTYTVIQ